MVDLPEAHWKILAASDFFTVEVWTSRGLTTYYVLFVIGIADRVVHVAGITRRPDEAWMLQIGRNLVDEQDGALAGRRYLIIDRDTKYSERFREFVEEGGTKVIRLPPLSPDLNAYAERCLEASYSHTRRMAICLLHASGVPQRSQPTNDAA